MLPLFSEKIRTFRHGIHPHDFKEITRDLPIERMPFPEQVVLPLSQHLGAPSKPVVRIGDRVYRGQLIAEPGGFVSSALHASVTGTVIDIRPHNHPSGKLVDAIIIKTDPHSSQVLYDERSIPWQQMPKEELVSLIRNGGFVGLGGAAFPTHVKLSIPEGKYVKWFMVNAAECEPFLTADHRIMLEYYDSIFFGIRIIMKILGAEKTYIGTEVNKAPALEKLQQAMPEDLNCEIVPLETKYPQGAEKMLTEAVLHREIPSGKLPLDIHVIVNNVGTVAAIGDFFRFGQPVIERVVTVSGPGITRPANLLVPVGIQLSDVIDHCGGMREQTRQILFGGPMMGAAQRNLDVPVLKGTSGIIFLTGDIVEHRQEYPCIKCMRCVEACPVYLNPSRLGAFAKKRLYDEMLAFHLMDCIECGSCSYVCPSNIPLVQRFRVAKSLIREKMAREKAG